MYEKIDPWRSISITNIGVTVNIVSREVESESAENL